LRYKASEIFIIVYCYHRYGQLSCY